MILEIKKLMAKGEYTGGFSFVYQPPQDLNLLPLCKIDGEVKVEGSYEIFEDDEVELTLKISYKLVGQCSYCLADAEEQIEYETGPLLFVTDGRGEDDYVYDGNRLDLSQAVTDAILFSQPKVLLCEKDLKGEKIE